MTTAMRATENRILAKRVKGKFTTPVEDVVKVRVLSNGVVSVAGTPYRSDTAGYKPRDVVEAVNVQNKGNARYRAKFGNTQTIVEGNTIINQVTNTAVTTTTQITQTLDGLIKGVIGPFSSSNRTLSFIVPTYVQEGDTIVFFTSARCYARVTTSDGENDSWYVEFTYYDLEDDTWATNATEFPPAAIAMACVTRIATSGDAGSTLTLKWRPEDWPLYADESTYNLTHFKPIGFVVILDGSHATDDFPSVGSRTSYGSDSGEVEIVNSQNYELTFWLQSIYETGSTTPELFVTELCDVSINGNHLYVGARIVPSATTLAWNGVSEDNIFALVNFIKF